MTIIQTIILAIVEGLTEFLPVSSTGHMIITQGLLGIESTPFVKAFTIIIQFGAILSVVCLYWNRFFRLDHSPAAAGSTPLQKFLHKWDFYWKLLVAFVPAVVIGLIGKKTGLIDRFLESVEVVAIMLVVGGIFMLFCDRIFNQGSEENQITEKRAFNIGLFQCIAMIPGVSRSMATIVGGMAQKLTRRAAAEFSFFLAVPTMAAATVLDVYELFFSSDAATAGWATTDNLMMLGLGSVVAFVVALLAMKWFVAFLTKYGFRAFGIYRIIVGGFILFWLLSGHSLAMVG
ncbi:undecaprenyl-diphosphatase UppP [Prevotella sp. DNF00663]|uniref:undecaprenyl-diphosphate phosphatase n=1 Tax=unclassified Prevotella TaxID=2638335 RepID=UPI0005140ACC|nr:MULTISPECIES: undecaprenyl-diphosphate phosphatase [unclassified Prevotella]KGI59700.1 UDP-diphosphatase [Prevotella sp. S7 MS 2]KXB81341.1 undecaprenyl-diphosphatase UppP [Prevotella sp. DNF00663]